MSATRRVPRTFIALGAILGALSCGDGSDAHPRGSERVPKLSGPELIPQELVAALLTGSVAPGTRPPVIVVGRLPDEMPFEVPRPAHARIVGAISRPRTGTIVLAVRERPLEAMKKYRELLRQSGWDDPGRERGSGFQPSPIVHSGTFCRGDDRSIATTAAERSDEETFLQVRYSDSDDNYSPCHPRQIENMALDRGPLPTFYPPQNTSIIDAQGGGGMNHTEASARLRTALRPADLVAHYGAQLRSDGWVAGSDALGKDVVAQSWRVEDRSGTGWLGVLVATAIPDSDDREVLFRVTPVELRRRRG